MRHDQLKELGVENPRDYEVLNSRNSPLVGRAVDHIYEKHQRHGMLRREVERLVNQDRNYFTAAMLSLGEADAMITGTTRPFSQSLNQVRMVIDDEQGAGALDTPSANNLGGTLPYMQSGQIRILAQTGKARSASAPAATVSRGPPRPRGSPTTRTPWIRPGPGPRPRSTIFDEMCGLRLTTFLIVQFSRPA